MKEKLIEHWLDSIGERGYQSAFLQMLVGEGHTIVHSTRHSPIEFGKDVITIDAEGTPCAFQLKGNPGSRLTLSQFREIRPQLTELIEQPIVYPGVSDRTHKCFLVTNGEVDEEVQRAIDDMNRELTRRGFQEDQHLKILSRGQLLSWAIRYSGDFWPDDFSVHEHLIQMFNVDGRDQPDLELISKSLDAILAVSHKRSNNNRSAFARSMIAASLFVSFSIRNYVKSNNHNSIIAAWVSVLAMYACAIERYDFELSGDCLKAYEAARFSMMSALLELLDSLQERLDSLTNNSDEHQPDINRIYLQAGSLSDRVLWNSRALKAISLLSLIRIEEKQLDTKIELDEHQSQTLRQILKLGATSVSIWGEAAVPQVFAHILALRISDPTFHPNMLFHEVLRWIVSENTKSEIAFVPSPYHDLNDCIRSQLSTILEGTKDIGAEVIPRSSYFAEGLLHCFVRANFKSYCKSIWPDLTRLSHIRFIPGDKWEYGLWRAENGQTITRQFPHRYNWADLQREAAQVDAPNIPSQLRNDPVVLLAFLIYYPHRGIPEALRFLHFNICGTWFLPFPKPDKR